LRAEKKHLKQEKARHKEELDQCHVRIHQLEAKLAEQTASELEEKLKITETTQDEIEELQMQLGRENDNHVAIVGELEHKIAQQEEELSRLHQEQQTGTTAVGQGQTISPAKASSQSRDIQQYKNKLQSLRLAMEVAVRRTETEWKEKVDDLEVQMATQEGEFEDVLEKKEEELTTQITQLQEQVEYCEKSHELERTQLEATITKLKSGLEIASSTAVDEELKKTKDELRSLQKQQAQSMANQQAVVTEARALIAQVDMAEPRTLPGNLSQQAMILEQKLNAMEPNNKSREPAVKRLSRRKSSRVNEKKLRHVTDMDWTGSNQRGKYTGYVGESGEPHGRGHLKMDNGDVYEGGFRKGRREGQGVYTWSTGDLYTGPWHSNKRHGHGCFVWADGRLYDGEYNMGKREGRGCFTVSCVLCFIIACFHLLFPWLNRSLLASFLSGPLEASMKATMLPTSEMDMESTCMRMEGPIRANIWTIVLMVLEF